MSNIKVQIAETDEQILKCWDALYALRPHLIEADFLTLIREIQASGYVLAYVESDGKAAAIIGYRYLHFLTHGKHIYIDDLSTLPEARGKGYGSTLLDFVKNEALQRGLKTVTLDSGHHRYDAHRLYLNEGYKIMAHHFLLTLEE